jgi:DASS family divalent anion:Na+ symporter
VNDKVKKFTWQGANIKSLAFVILLGSLLWFSPVPEGLTTQTWHLFAIFFATIVALIAKPLPMGAVAVLSIATATLTGTLTLQQSLSKFSSNIVWLIVTAFLLARGFIKTGLGSRIAYYFISVLGKKTIGLAYGLTTTEFLLAPFMPSNTARGAGIIYPIISSLNKEFDSNPEQGTERKIGSYLIKLLYQVNVVTSAMFLTATAPNPLICGLAQKHDIIITWGDWALAALVPGLCNLIVTIINVLFISSYYKKHS